MRQIISFFNPKQWAMLALAVLVAVAGYGEVAPFMFAAVPISADNPSAYGPAGTYPDRTGVFIPELWSGKLLEKFYASTVFGMIANTDYEGQLI